MVNVTEDLEVNPVKHIALDFDDILSPHLFRMCILDDCYLGVQFVQAELIVDIKALSRLDMIQNNALRKTADI